MHSYSSCGNVVWGWVDRWMEGVLRLHHHWFALYGRQKRSPGSELPPALFDRSQGIFAVVCGDAVERHINKLHATMQQKEALRIIHKAPYNAHTQMLFNQSKISILKKITLLQTAQNKHQPHNNTLPPSYMCMFQYTCTCIYPLPQPQTSTSVQNSTSNFCSNT